MVVLIYFYLIDRIRSSSFLFCSFNKQIYLSWFVLSSLIWRFRSSSLEGLYFILGSSCCLPLLSTELFYLKMFMLDFLFFLPAAWMFSYIKADVLSYRSFVLRWPRFCRADVFIIRRGTLLPVLPSWVFLKLRETRYWYFIVAFGWHWVWIQSVLLLI